MPVHDFTRLGMTWRWLAGRGRRGPELSGEGPVIGVSERGAPIHWSPPTAQAAQSIFLPAASGAGKTAMLASAVVQEAVAPQREPAQRPAYVIIDGKNDLCHAVLHGLAAADPSRLADGHWLAPFEDGFPFNLCRLSGGATPLEVRALALAQLTSRVSQMQADGGSGSGARQLEVWTNVYHGAIDCAHPAASPLWALDALSEPRHGLKRLAAVTRSERARQFLSSAHLSEELRASCASRVRTALALTDQLEKLVAAPDCISPAELTRPGSITLVPLGNPTGGIDSLQRLYGSLVGRIIIEHLFERPSQFRGHHHVRLIFDEAQVVSSVLSSYLDALLTRGRSLSLSACIITQGTTLIQQASDTIVPLLMTNAPLKIVGRLAAPDAELLARNLGPRAGIDETVAAVRSRFVVSATNLKDREFNLMRPGETTRFRSADVDLKGWDVAALRHADLIAAVKTRLAPQQNGPRITLQQATGHLSFPEEPRGRGRGRGQTEVSADRAKSSSPPEKSDERPTPPNKPRSRWG